MKCSQDYIADMDFNGFYSNCSEIEQCFSCKARDTNIGSDRDPFQGQVLITAGSES